MMKANKAKMKLNLENVIIPIINASKIKQRIFLVTKL